jgi:cysteine desulfurase family protein
LKPIYLDNAATTFPKPEAVYRALDCVARQIGVAPNRGGYRQSLEASRLIFETRESLASLLGVADSSRIILTHSATESLNLAIKGVLRPGDHVVTTSMEHNSLARPLHAAAATGVKIDWVQADAEGYVTAASILAAVRPDTRLVAMTHCSNVSGSVNPVAEIGALLKETDVIFLVDGAQSAGSLPIELAVMNIDLFAAPGHKGLYGPQGTGLLYVAPGIRLEPLLHGGTGGGSSELELPLELPERYESGTMNTPAVAGLKAAVDFLLDKGVTTVHAAEQQLVSRLITGLTGIAGVTVYNRSPDRPRGSVVSFTVAGMDPSRTGFLLDSDYGIAVRVGLHCAPLAHRTIGTYPEGTVRVSPGIFNTEEDIDRFIAAVAAIAGESCREG